MRFYRLANSERSLLRTAKERTKQQAKIFAETVLAKKQITKMSYCKPNPHRNLRTLLARARAQHIIHNLLSKLIFLLFEHSSLRSLFSHRKKIQDLLLLFRFWFVRSLDYSLRSFSLRERCRLRGMQFFLEGGVRER